MTKLTLVTMTAVAALLAAAPVMAQGTLSGTDALNDRLDDIEENVADDLAEAEDAARFGNPEFRPGLSGSASLGYSGKTGNNESQDFSAGARLRFAQGQLVQTLGLALDFSEADGMRSKEDVFAVYDANYYLDDSFYVFGLARLEYDGLANTASDIRRDGFVGFGPGYRILNTQQVAWRVQVGVGLSYLEDGLRDSETEIGYIAASRFFYAFNENVFLTNDTDVLSSDTALRVNNDFGVNFKMSDAFSTRVSYLTEYNDARATRTDNKLGVSIVYGF